MELLLYYRIWNRIFIFNQYIAEHIINKILYSYFYSKHPKSDKCQLAIWNTAKRFDKDTFEYSRADYTTQILHFYYHGKKSLKL